MKILLTIFLSLFLHLAASADIFWTEYGSGEISSSSDDGSNATTFITGLSRPSGIDVDELNSKVYWTDRGNNTIQRANLDGSNIETLLSSGLSDAFGIALDVPNGKMYWADAATDKIQRANLDGSNVEDVVTGLGDPEALTLDLTGSKLYWTNYVSGTVQSANLDGSNVTTLYSGFTSLEGIAFHSGNLYFADRSTGNIYSGAADGSGYSTLLSGQGSPIGVTVSPASGKIYWVDDVNDTLKRANLDGSNITLLHAPDRPKGISFSSSSAITPPTVSFTLPFSTTISEGESGTVGVTLAGTITAPLTVSINITNVDSSTLAEITSPSHVTFFPEGSTQQSITINIASNSTENDDRSFKLALSIPSNSDGAIIGNNSEKTILINDTTPITVSFSSTSVSITEGDSLQLGLSLTHPLAESVTAQISILNTDSATISEITIPTTITFSAGEGPDFFIPISLADNTISDSNRSFRVSLLIPQNTANLSFGSITSTTLQIINNDFEILSDWVDYYYPGVPLSEGLEADPDGDGLVSYIEWMTDSSPTDTKDAKKTIAGTKTVDGSDYLTLSFFFNPNKTDYDVSVETSTDMIKWTPLWLSSADPNLNSPYILNSSGASPGWVTIRNNQAISQLGFIQLKYTKAVNDDGGDDEESGGGGVPPK